MNSEIKTLDDLYNLVLPALKSKRKELHSLNYFYITEKDIWNYLSDNTWNNSHDLTLHDMVDDILNTSNDLIAAYVASNLREDEINY